MPAARRRTLYHTANTLLVRATANTTPPVASWPDLMAESPADVRRLCAWLRTVWAVEAVAEAVEHASPALADAVAAVCAASAPENGKVRRVALSLTRYLLRLEHRPTPFGLFAGVCPAAFGSSLTVRWGTGHRAVARVGAAWLGDVVEQLEACPVLLARLPLMVNNTAFVRGNLLIVPYPAQTGSARRTGVSMRLTAPLRTALDTAQTPILCGDLQDKLGAEFPAAKPSKVAGLLSDLVGRGALLSSLHAPSTVMSAFGHLMAELHAAKAAEIPAVKELVNQLADVQDLLVEHERAQEAAVRRTVRAGLRRTMTAVSAVAEQPVAVDLITDCSLTLPQSVAREVERAATLLARLTPYPFGTAAWQEWHNRFFERYGVGSVVPVQDAIDPDVGLGFPAGYLDTDSPRPPSLSDRDRRLLSMAQSAALDGAREVVLDDALLGELIDDQATARMQLAQHLELRFHVSAASQEAVDRGDFQIEVVSASRGIGTTTGRFLGLLDPADHEMAAVLDDLPTADPGTLPVQLCFPPLARKDGHVIRVPELLRAVISLGEHRAPADDVIPIDDLAVGCDRRRLFLASIARGCRVEATTLHALDLRAHTPPLARFLADIGRAQTAVVAAFDWGAAARLPFLPRLRQGRIVVSAARWRLDATDLPGPEAAWRDWHQAIHAWRERRRLPRCVLLAEGDQQLRLDLDIDAHLVLLRTALDRTGHAFLVEAGTSDARGWFAGHAHEIVAPLTVAEPATWPAAPPVTATRVLSRDHGHIPGDSPWLLAKLYGHPGRQAEIVADHLPGLWTLWDEPPVWWFMRYKDPRPHLRLRIALPDPTAFGEAAAHVGAWATRLRNNGLLNDLQFATSYPETGRWGSGVLMRAADDVFAADSRVLAVQFAQRSRSHWQALTAANFVAIACAFTGSPEAGMQWLVRFAAADAPGPIDRAVHREAIRLADPSDDWAALRTTPTGPAIVQAWGPRERALRRYRGLLRDEDGLGPDLILDSLLHAHHIRAAGIAKDDERVCVRLARAAALAWTHRAEQG
ncbi:lantibiotic dehydratase [Yinghuangia soli]|uniref:Lantibiotic dehydratase n=1 Tax=Yinghuangia soli TaxID=2908204 RepID=A0AA41U4T7_9ACTN|nr:lantibiotic dehydratase [Yinghuangia soli]MCF2531152.1 lantibiotic dehydratase [Yinghuangia soli]